MSEKLNPHLTYLFLLFLLMNFLLTACSSGEDEENAKEVVVGTFPDVDMVCSAGISKINNLSQVDISLLLEFLNDENNDLSSLSINEILGLSNSSYGMGAAYDADSPHIIPVSIERRQEFRATAFSRIGS